MTTNPIPSNTPPHSHRQETAAVVSLVTLVLLLFCAGWHRTSEELWNQPTRYSGDDVHSLALLKAARDGHILPFTPIHVPKLGAPAGANWNGFLRQHKLQWLAGGLLARLTGLWLASNMMLLATHLLSALSFYGVARVLRARCEWAATGAVLFSFAPFMFWRGLGHLTVAAYWPIPLALLAIGWCTSRRALRFRSRRFVAAATIAVAVGLHNVYYAALVAQFLVMAGLIRVLRLRKDREIIIPLMLVAIVIGTVLLDNANQPLDLLLHGRSEATLLRPYGNLERFALKPIELLLPMEGTGWVVPGALSRAHWAGSIYRGELGSAYLGLAGILSLAWLLARGLVPLVRARPAGALLPLLSVAWVVIFSVVGGANNLLGILGFVWLRGTNRYSIWILAVALLTATVASSRIRWTRRSWSLVAALLVQGVGLTDQIPRAAAADSASVRDALASDRTFVASVEALLPEDSATFVSPALDFPEAPRSFREQDYEPLRLYLHASRLRLSYGTDKNRPGASAAPDLDALPISERVDALLSRGFSGLILVCRALPDGGETLLEELEQLGYRQVVRSVDGQFLYVPLRVRVNDAPR